MSCLLLTAFEELIELMGWKTCPTIADEIQDAKYFLVIADSTPDLTHVDHLTFIFRFVRSGNVLE